MTFMGLPASIMDAIIAVPTLLGSSDKVSSLGMSHTTAEQILSGYHHGFQIVFTLNAGLAAFATVVSIVMIKEEDLSSESENAEMEKSTDDSVTRSDPEMGEVSPVRTKD